MARQIKREVAKRPLQFNCKIPQAQARNTIFNIQTAYCHQRKFQDISIRKAIQLVIIYLITKGTPFGTEMMQQFYLLRSSLYHTYKFYSLSLEDFQWYQNCQSNIRFVGKGHSCYMVMSQHCYSQGSRTKGYI